MDSDWKSGGYKHVGTLTKEDLTTAEVKLWKPNYPIGPNFEPEWTPIGAKVYQSIVAKNFKCAGNCDDAMGSSHKDYTEGPIRTCSCFTDESNIDLYFNINTQDPAWKQFLKEIEKK